MTAPPLMVKSSGEFPTGSPLSKLHSPKQIFHFDGSDLMPGAVGAGSFWTGIVDYVSGTDLDTVLSNIDASWPAE